MRNDNSGSIGSSNSGGSSVIGVMVEGVGAQSIPEGAHRNSEGDRRRSWADLRRTRAAQASPVMRAILSPWFDLLLVSLAFLTLVLIATVETGCGGVAKSTAGCVESSIRVCEPPKDVSDPGQWLTYAVCLADDALPCVIGSVAAGQSGCPNLQECLELSPCNSADGCRAIVELCLDECR